MVGVIVGWVLTPRPERSLALEPEPSPPLDLWTATGWPRLHPLPEAAEIWECEVAVVGGSLGGVAAAHHAMRSGATTCLIELTPWLGGQISSQGVSAIDESLPMRERQNFSASWFAFKAIIENQTVQLPAWTGRSAPVSVTEINSCWVGGLCFPPEAGARASEAVLQQAQPFAPESRWGTSIAFKGAEFSTDGSQIQAIYAVQRQPRDPHYLPMGRLAQEFTSWYSWAEDDTFSKTPIRLQAPPGKRMIVIDATDTGELVAWAGIPYRIGSEAKSTTGEPFGAPADNPECTQAFTFPFVLAIHDDQGRSQSVLAQLQSGHSRAEHRLDYDLADFPMFAGKSVFQYRRIVSLSRNDPFYGVPALGDMTMINWNKGNDWALMDPPLLMTPELIRSTGQHHNWLGGMNFSALKDGENHALLFAEWLMETQSRPYFPLALLSGPGSPMGTESGLSMMPYIREGRRILGRAAYGDEEFMITEHDIRRGLTGRDFTPTVVGLTHYAIDMHGCRYRNWEPANNARSAPANEYFVRPIQIPLESLIPQQVDNLLIGGKGIAVTHIVNAATRTHYGEWSIGAAAGAVAGWFGQQSDRLPPDIQDQDWPELHQHLQDQGLRWEW